MEVSCHCQHCDKPIYFEVERVGSMNACPHCNLETPLFVPVAQKRQSFKRVPNLGTALLIVLVTALLVFLIVKVPEGLGFIGGLCLLAIGTFIYFLPSYVGRNKKNATAILVLNLFLGWTFIGWVVALVWACSVDSDSK